MKRFLIILLLLFGIGIFSNEYLAQTGGKKREHKQRARKSFGKKSAGNADVFASGGTRRGIFSRLFKRKQGAWAYKSSGSRRSHYRDNRNLFGRFRSKGKQSNDAIQERQNRERAKKRVRGNKVFSKKKY